MKKELEKSLEQSPIFRHLDLDKVKTFYYIAKIGSFTNAAKFLHTFQPGLSRQVAALEQTLGAPLFTRQPRGVVLTRKGEELFSLIEPFLLELINFTHRRHAALPNGKKRKIRISSTHAINAYILYDLMFAYNQKHPEFVFELISDDYIIDIVLNDVDVAIRPSEGIKESIHEEYLFTLEKKLYASPEYLKKFGEPKTVEDLKDHHIISRAHPEDYPYSDLEWILRLGMPKGKLHTPVFTSTSTECLIKAALNGVGIIASYEKMEFIRNSPLKNILSDVVGEGIQEFFVYPDYLKEDEDIKKFKEYLVEKIRE